MMALISLQVVWKNPSKISICEAIEASKTCTTVQNLITNVENIFKVLPLVKFILSRSNSRHAMLLVVD